MKIDVAYEVADMRPVPVGRFGVLRSVPGGLKVVTESGESHFLEWDDEDDEAFVDHEDQGMLSIMTPTGRIEFRVLELSNWDELEPFWISETPEFQSDEEVNEFVYDRLRGFA